MSNPGRWSPWYTDQPDVLPFGDTATYTVAEQWLSGLDVEDWGCGYGWFRTVHRGGYLGIDGTAGHSDIVVDLVDYRSETPGLLLRHVLEHDVRWPRILANAEASATHTLVIVVFTPLAEVTTQIGWNEQLRVPDLSLPHDQLALVCPEWVNYRTQTEYGVERVYVRR